MDVSMLEKSVPQLLPAGLVSEDKLELGVEIDEWPFTLLVRGIKENWRIFQAIQFGQEVNRQRHMKVLRTCSHHKGQASALLAAIYTIYL